MVNPIKKCTIPDKLINTGSDPVCVIILLKYSSEIRKPNPVTKKYNDKGIIHPEKVLEALDRSGAPAVTLIFEIIHAHEAEETVVIQDIKESIELWKRYLK